MNDSPAAPVIEPITASADGRRNAFTHSCRIVQQKMSYAACLNRQAQIKAGTAPRDWSACDTGACNARGMRAEEELAGKAIYFTPRGTVATAAASAGRWVVNVAKKAFGAAPAPRRDMFDAMGDVGSMADAINASSTTAAPVVRAPTTPMPVALPGESPLAMARRLKAEKEAKAAA